MRPLHNTRMLFLIALVCSTVFSVSASSVAAQSTRCAASTCKVFLPSIVTPVELTAVTGTDTDLFVAAGSTIARFDRTNPIQPQLRERVTLPNPAFVTDLFYTAPFLYVVQQTQQQNIFSTILTLYTWQANTTPQLRGHYVFNNGTAVTVSGGMAYGVTDDAILTILDLSDPDNLAVRSTLFLGSNHQGSVAVKNQTVYVAGSLYLTIVDARDPVRPRIIATPSLPTNANAAVVDGDSLYVPLYRSNGQIYDIRAPQQPQLKHSFSALPLLDQLVTDSTYLYVAGLYAPDETASRLEVFVRSTTAQELPFRGGISLPSEPSGVFARDGIAYVSLHRGGLLIIDVRPPELPRIVGKVGFV